MKSREVKKNIFDRLNKWNLDKKSPTSVLGTLNYILIRCVSKIGVLVSSNNVWYKHLLVKFFD